MSQQTFYPDDPFWDATPNAHPAWFRGYDYGLQVAASKVGMVVLDLERMQREEAPAARQTDFTIPPMIARGVPR